ncbi:MAG: hypothetical protein ACR2PZ_09700 [Pseudomonadales bacterium]
MKFEARMALAGLCAAVLVFSTSVRADDWDDDEEIPFDEAFVFFELNNTDGDLGIHAKIDGGPWKRLHIERDADDRKLLDIRVRSSLRRQGLTELFFESAEPTFDELPPEKFFRRFPEGEYEVEGISTEGEELESETELTHLMPAPPRPYVNGMRAAPDCDSELPVVSGDAPIVIRWRPVTMSHPTLGRTGERIEVVNYEAVVEIDETPYKVSAILPPTATSFVVPAEIVALGDEIKFEILVREASYNQTAVESCFEVE